MKDYETELNVFLEWCQSRLVEVFDAGGVREVWLQAEAFRYFRYHRKHGPVCLWTNAHNRNDLAFYETDESSEPVAVVEIKLFGLKGYYSKNLTGHSDMSPYVAPPDGERFTFRPEHAGRCHRTEGSILKDYQKLLAQGRGAKRFMLLVLDTRSADDADAFGRAIGCVDFGGPGVTVLSAAGCSATLWEVS